MVSTSTLDHFDDAADLERALRELHRVLRPGGSFIVTLDNASNPLIAVRNVLPFGLLHRVGLVPYPTGRTLGLDGLRERVGAAGFVVNAVDTIMHVPRLAVRSAAPAVVRDPARIDRFLSALLRMESPLPFPLRRVSGQFVAVRATRPPAGPRGRPPGRETHLSPAPLSGGPRAVAMRVLGRTFYRRLIWMELPLDQMPPAIEACVPLEFGFLGEGDIPEIAAFRPDLRPPDLAARFARGDRCFGARRAGRLVSASWVATGAAPVEYLAVAPRLPRDTAYFYDRYTDARTRGLRVAPAAGSALCRMLADEGIVKVTAAVHPDNAIAMAHAVRLGLRPVGCVGSLRIGSIRRSFGRPLSDRPSYAPRSRR